jgi:hypothetical protein
VTDLLAAVLQDEFDTEVEDSNLVGVVADLMSYAMGEVNWRDIAEHVLADLDKQD